MEVLFLLFAYLPFALLIQVQSQPGFISIDCGMAESPDYNDISTNILYTSDAQYINTGTAANISSVFMSNTIPRHLSTVRSFPQGINNCYTFKPEEAKGNKYLIRAIFMYGNYDSREQPPEFSLYLDSIEWDTVRLTNNSTVIKEIIHVPATDYIHVCLINTDSGTPFISALELRQLNNSMYETQSGSLALVLRLDIGSTTNQIVRYGNDVYDRVWQPFSFAGWEPFSASYESEALSSNVFRLPSAVMRTAVRPVSGGRSLNFFYNVADSTQRLYIYLHFAELQELQANQSRKYEISLNGVSWWDESQLPGYQVPFTVYSTNAISADSGALNFSIIMSTDSTLPPILNALEIYMVKEFPQSPTDQSDVDAIRDIKSVYGLHRNWQGDPCATIGYQWDGIDCSNNDNSPTITSLNLSSSALNGSIVPSIFNLKALEHLDLSNNSLTGSVPDFFSQMPALKTLNLSGNMLTGSIPSALIDRSSNGLLLSSEGNPNLCQKISCKKKKNVVIPVVASVVSCFVLLAAFAILWSLRRRKLKGTDIVVKAKENDRTLESSNQHFTYSEVVKITSNFQQVLGKGGFGTVYGGYMEDGTQVAVKMLSSSSKQGSTEFRAEAQLLTKVHHRNLASLIGYCNESAQMGLIYEYMANGNLEEYLSGKNEAPSSWEQRLRIAVDTAQALEYLHNGCKPPIIHRDIKTSNILLNEKLQAKVADFGLSRLMPLDGGTHVSTAVVGTFGYLDPDYYICNRLNERSDVYSFGIVLLELITGQPAILKGHENTHIVQWVNSMLQTGDVRNITDTRLHGDFDINSVWKAVETAMACIPANSIQRPTMSYVLVELKECLEMETSNKRISANKDDFESNYLVIDLQNSMGPDAR